MCFLVSDNVFSQIFCNCLNVRTQMKYFLDIIVHLVCRKMCSKNFGNRLINKKKFGSKKIEYGFSVQKSHERKVNILPKEWKILGFSL